ncbi:hypothetical protein [Streptococcus halichoeri]|nr:hypothetical protein [Streptococcus halichoeri]
MSAWLITSKTPVHVFISALPKGSYFPASQIEKGNIRPASQASR